jgi:hypothetical protein
MKLRHRLGALIGALALLGSAIAGSQAATSDNATVAIITNGNALSASITGTTFGSIPYSFTDSAPLAGNMSITAIDPRGTAAGWNIVLSATNFIGANNVAHVIPVSRLGLTPGAITPAFGSAAGQTTFPLAPVTTSAQKIWSAALGAGDGQYTLAVPASLVVPGGTLVDSYTSVVTVSITSGP